MRCFHSSTLVLSFAIFTSATAAQTPQGEKVAFALAITDTWHYAGTDAVIIRRATGQPRDVVLLRSSASQQQVAAAIEELRRVRAAFGDLPVEDALFRVRRAEPMRRATRVESHLRKLRQIPAKQLANVGEVRYVVLGMTRQSR